MAGAIIEGKEIKSAVREEAQVCIIGSGASGALIAHQLSARGVKVIVLEEGGAYFRRDYPDNIRDCIKKMYRNLGLDSTLGIPSIVVPTGKCLGGTTVVNMGTCFRVPDWIYQKWEEMGIEGWGKAELEPYYEQVEKLMNVQEVKPEVMGRNGEIIAEGARRLGLHPKPIRRNVSDDCKGCGNCSYGCPEDAKQAMHIKIIPQAVESGAKFYCDAKAEIILHDGKKVLGVQGSIRERETGAFRHHIDIACDVVVLCAGALNTPVLLLKNKIANSSGEVGKNLKLHLCGRVSGFFDQYIDGHYGVGQCLYIDDYAKDFGIMLEATFTGPASEFPGFPGFGAELWEMLKEYRKTATVGVMVSDTSSGRVSVGIDGEPMLSYNLNQKDAETLKKAMIISGRILFAAGAKKLITTTSCFPIINSLAELEKAQDTKVSPSHFLLMAFHPLGTCRMGAKKKKSVVNLNLETWDLKNLFIADASVFPSSLGVNPQETIWAFAYRGAEYILENVL